MLARRESQSEPERTLVLVKPDGVQDRRCGQILCRLEETGLILVGMKLCRVTKQRAELHVSRSVDRLEQAGQRELQWCDKQSLFPMEIYNSVVPESIGRKVREWRIDFLMSGPVVAMVLEGEDAVAAIRKMVGHWFPEQSLRGTIRNDFGRDTALKAANEKRAVRNVVHASSSPQEAEREISVWFSPAELL